MGKQKGFGVVEIIIIIVIIIGIGGLVWYVWQRQQKTEPVQQTTQVVRSYDDPCKLVDKSEVEAAFGLPFGDFKGEPAVSDGRLTSLLCTITQTQEGSAKVGDGLSFSVKIESYRSVSDVQIEIDLTRASAQYGENPPYELTDVSGLGEEAFFFVHKQPPSPDTQISLRVRKDTKIFEFTALRLNGLDTNKAKPQLEELAKKVF